MWIMSKYGFLSIVRCHAPREAELAVRARNGEHLRAALDAAGIIAEVEESDGTDYRYRAFLDEVDARELAMALMDAIDYGNFKSECDARHGRTDQYANALHQAWTVMERTQDVPAYGSRRRPPPMFDPGEHERGGWSLVVPGPEGVPERPLRVWTLGAHDPETLPSRQFIMPLGTKRKRRKSRKSTR